MRNALLASVAFVFVAGVLATGIASPAAAATTKSSAKSKPEANDFGQMPKGPLQIVVSIAHQHVTLYSNGTRVAQGPVSTGMPGKPTPTGVFSIIQKDRYHHSNLYSNAPMPFMERITWSGVALHEGPLPGYAASHGCIRMTHEFALRLWGITNLGVRVIVSHADVAPVDFAHPLLFVPKAKPEAPVADDDARKHAQLPAPIRFAQATAPATDAAPTAPDAKPSADPLRGSLEGNADPDSTATTSIVPGAPGNPPEAVTPPAVVQAAPVSDDPPKPASAIDDPAKSGPSKPAPKARVVEQLPKHAGQVAVFISRKEKRLFVRQGFVPLFDMPVEIEHPEQPFGTHVFTAMEVTDGGAGMRWNLMSIPAEPARVLASAKVGKKKPAEAPVEAFDSQSAAQVLDRIQIPQEAKDRIGEILAPGSSLVVSDQGLGGETGQGTDFIVLTR